MPCIFSVAALTVRESIPFADRNERRVLSILYIVHYKKCNKKNRNDSKGTKKLLI